MTRIATSRGFSVSRSSMRRLTSGILDFCAATMRRLETLSGQTRTCWPAAPPEAPLPDELLLDGGGVGPSDMTTPGGLELLLRLDEEDRDEEDEDELDGGAGWELRTSVSKAPSSSASEYFNGKNSMTTSPPEGTSSSRINSVAMRMLSVKSVTMSCWARSATSTVAFSESTDLTLSRISEGETFLSWKILTRR